MINIFIVYIKSLLFDIGIRNFGIWVYHHETTCCVHSWPLKVWTLTFDLYVGGGGSFLEFYSQFLSCFLMIAMIEKIVHKHFVLGTDLVLPSHMHHRNGNSSKRFVSHQILLESLAPGPNHWGPHFSKDNNFIVKIH